MINQKACEILKLNGGAMSFICPIEKIDQVLYKIVSLD